MIGFTHGRDQMTSDVSLKASPAAVGKAVLAEFGLKFAELTHVQWEANLAHKRWEEHLSKLEEMKRSLDDMKTYLNEHHPEFAQEIQKLEDGEYNITQATQADAEKQIVGGRDLRRAVLFCAHELASRQGYFSVGDLWEALRQRFVLRVQSPKARASQVLTLESDFQYDAQRRAWRRSV